MRIGQYTFYKLNIIQNAGEINIKRIELKKKLCKYNYWTQILPDAAHHGTQYQHQQRDPAEQVLGQRVKPAA